MLTLKKLLVATPQPVMARALLQCRTTITRSILEIDEFGNKRKNVAGLVRATDGDRFAVIMFYEPDKKNLADSKIWVHCSCPYYTFNVEVVNALKKSSDVINSNGDLPVVRNPRMIPHLCKHVAALAKFAVRAKAKDLTPKQKPTTTKKPPPATQLERPGQKRTKQYTKKPVNKIQKPAPKAPPGPRQPMQKPGQKPAAPQQRQPQQKPGQRPPAKPGLAR